jgi:nitrite reductase/ring-hydroxylating ferredoxin subunit
VTYYATLCSISDFPAGELKRFRVGGREIGVANVEGTFYAFANECTHQFAWMTDGFVRRNCEIVCIHHWAVFDLATGNVVEGPGYAPLAVYPTRVEGDELQIGWPKELTPAEIVSMRRF